MTVTAGCLTNVIDKLQDLDDYLVQSILRICAASREATRDGREKFRIGTVDSFQGKEFDVVILSATRSNTIERKEGNVRKVFGFLTSENRLNVAFSRAQRLLIVCGDSEMFNDEYAQTYVNGLYEFYVNQSTDKNYGARII